MLIRLGGTTATEYLTRVLRFRRARSAEWTELSGGLLTDHPRAADLPGILAPIVPVETDDGRGGRQCLLWDRRNGRLASVLRLSPVGLDLADAEQADIWVAGWGSLLADLGYHRLITGLTVTIDTAPSGGTTIRQHVAKSLDRNAPALARRVLDELVAATPSTAAEIDARATISIDPNRATPRPADLVEACVDAVRGLPAIENGLASGGVAVLGRADTGYLLGRIRAAFDPTARPWLTDTDDELIRWADAGPVAASERWESYRHDSGPSVTWGMREAPRQSVASRVLAPLLAPGPFPRRVCLVYEPYPAEQTAAKVEAEITSGQIRQAWAERTRRAETQRDRDDRHRALQSAREEAEGAGVGLQSYVLPHCGDRKLQDLTSETITLLYAHLLKEGRRKADDTNLAMFDEWNRALATGREARPRELAEAAGVSYSAGVRAAQRFRAGRVPGEATTGLSPSSIRSVHIMLNAAMNDAVELKYLSTNPVTHAGRVRQPHRPHQTWTPDELRRFLKVAREDRLYAMWLLFSTTGTRRSEAAGLRRDLVDTRSRTVTVFETLVVGSGKAVKSDGKSDDSRRMLALDKQTAEVLATRLATVQHEIRAFGDGYTDLGLAFCWPDGRALHPDTITEQFNRLVDRAGLPRITLHDVRHTYATVSLRAGVNPKIVSARLGHATVAFTLDTYTADVPELHHDAAETVSGLFLDPIAGRPSGDAE